MTRRKTKKTNKTFKEDKNVTESGRTVDLYGALGLKQDCTLDDIKKAYRTKALKCHPDKNPSSEAQDDFEKISYAYSVLSDPTKRSCYDRNGPEALETMDMPAEEFLHMFQGLFADMMGGVSGIKDMLSGMTKKDLAQLPPFPFPKELFPPGTFPEGLRFSSDGLAGVPPSVEDLLALGDAEQLATMFAGNTQHHDMRSGHPWAQTHGAARRGPANAMPARRGGASGKRAGGRRGGVGNAPGQRFPFGSFPQDVLLDSLGVPSDIDVRDPDFQAFIEEMLGSGMLDASMLDAMSGADDGFSTDEILQSMKASGLLNQGSLGDHVADLPPLAGTFTKDFMRAMGAAPHDDDTDQSSDWETDASCAGDDESESPIAPAQGSNFIHNFEGGSPGSASCDREADVAADIIKITSGTSFMEVQNDGKDKCSTPCVAQLVRGCQQQDHHSLKGQGTSKHVSAKSDESVTAGMESCAGTASAASESCYETSDASEESSDCSMQCTKQPDAPATSSVSTLGVQRTHSQKTLHNNTNSIHTTPARPSTTSSPGQTEGHPSPGRVKDWMMAAKIGDVHMLDSMLGQCPALLSCQAPGLGHTALHWAAARGHVDVMRMLLSRSADPAARNNELATPLHAAARNGQLDAVKLLLEVLLCTDVVQAVDSDGCTAEQLARQYKHHAVADVVAAASVSSEPAMQCASSRSSACQTEFHPQKDSQTSEQLQVSADTTAAPTATSSAPCQASKLHHQDIDPLSHNHQSAATSHQVPGSGQAEVTAGPISTADLPHVKSETFHLARNVSTPANEQHDASQSLEVPLNAQQDTSPAAEDALPAENMAAMASVGVAGPPHSADTVPVSGAATCTSTAFKQPTPIGSCHESQESSSLHVACSNSQSSQHAAQADGNGPSELTTSTRASRSTTTGTSAPGADKAQARAARRAALLAAAQEAEEREDAIEAQRVKAAAAAAIAVGVAPAEGRAWMQSAQAGDMHSMQSMLAINASLLHYQGQGTNFSFTGHTALHWAAAKGHAAAVAWILDQGGDVHRRNNAGCTPLHAAVSSGQTQCIRVLLLKGGADPQVPDDLGDTPRDLALRSGSMGNTLVATLDLLSRVHHLTRCEPCSWPVKTMRQVLALSQVNASGVVDRPELLALTQQVVNKCLDEASLTMSSCQSSQQQHEQRQTSQHKEQVGASDSMPGTATAGSDSAVRSGESNTTTSSIATSSNDNPSSSCENRSDCEDQAGQAALARQIEAAKQKGNQCFAAKDYQKAISHYTMAIRLSGNTPCPVLHSNRAAAYAAIHHFVKSLADADDAVSQAPDMAKAHNRRGAALFGMRRYEEAAAAYRDALQRDPGNTAAIQGLHQATQEAQYKSP